jgi:hypothetical protein
MRSFEHFCDPDREKTAADMLINVTVETSRTAGIARVQHACCEMCFWSTSCATMQRSRVYCAAFQRTSRSVCGSERTLSVSLARFLLWDCRALR